MSSTKVSSGVPVGSSSSAVKLNGVRSAAGASVSASVSAISDSANIGSSTDQYLQNQDAGVNTYLADETQEAPSPQPYSTLSSETGPIVHLQFQEDQSAYFSLQDVEEHVGSYERTLEQSEDSLQKKTQGFG